jgi:3-polyprenyl-4-hydroxybenzoate decarboxylase
MHVSDDVDAGKNNLIMIRQTLNTQHPVVVPFIPKNNCVIFHQDHAQPRVDLPMRVAVFCGEQLAPYLYVIFFDFKRQALSFRG